MVPEPGVAYRSTTGVPFQSRARSGTRSSRGSMPGGGVQFHAGRTPAGTLHPPGEATRGNAAWRRASARSASSRGPFSTTVGPGRPRTRRASARTEIRKAISNATGRLWHTASLPEWRCLPLSATPGSGLASAGGRSTRARTISVPGIGLASCASCTSRFWFSYSPPAVDGSARITRINAASLASRPPLADNRSGN